MPDYSIEFLLKFGEENTELLDDNILEGFIALKNKNIKKRPNKYKKNNNYFQDNSNKEFNLLLNKVSNNNIDELYINFLDLLKNEKNIVLFIDSIFECSISQPNYCNLYAKLINLLNNEQIRIKLLEKCKKFYYEKELIPISMELIQNNYELYCKSNKEKQKFVGCFKLIGELYLLELVDNTVMFNYINLLINNLKTLEDESINSYIECLLTLMKAISDKLKNNLDTNNYNNIMNMILLMSKDNKKFKPRCRFMLEDIYNILIK